MAGLEQQALLRNETLPADAIVVVRGGPDTVEKLRRHAARTASAWQLYGEPLYGVSVYCALDEVGKASLDRILSEMHSYRVVHLSTVGALVAGGFGLLATGSRPHFTVRTSGDDISEMERSHATGGRQVACPVWRRAGE